MAIRPHSEHSLSAKRSLDKVAESMMNNVGEGLVEEGEGASPLGEEGLEGGNAKAAS